MKTFGCGDIEAYHDGELTPAGAVQAAAHIASCPACRAALERLKSVDAALSAARQEPGPFFTARVMAAVRAAAPERRPLLAGWWKVPAIALAACAVYALCVETGLWPPGNRTLAAALSAGTETARARQLLFGGQRSDDANLLAMVLEGGSK